MNVPLLASLPFDLKVVQGSDQGRPLTESANPGPFLRDLEGLLDKVELGHCEMFAVLTVQDGTMGEADCPAPGAGVMGRIP